MSSGVYRITNIYNGKSYIGISNDIENRWKNEIRGDTINKGEKSLIEFAIRKYGEDCFYFEILEELEEESDRLEAEKMFIKRYNTKAPNGYNLTDGGEGRCGFKHSDDTKRKMREAHKGKRPSDEARRKMSEARYKPYARIIKSGFQYGKQRYAIMYEAKKIKHSFYPEKLVDYAESIGLEIIEEE